MQCRAGRESPSRGWFELEYGADEAQIVNQTRVFVLLQAASHPSNTFTLERLPGAWIYLLDSQWREATRRKTIGIFAVHAGKLQIDVMRQ